MTRRRSRSLTAEDRALWDHVVRGVTPLRPVREAEAPAPPEAPAPAAAAPPPAAPARPAPPRPPAPPPLAPLERRLRQRLGRGTVEVEARLDLHGLTQDAAHGRLVAFLRRSQAEGRKLVIVITGKGGRGDMNGRDPFAERGVLRRVVPHWLGLPEMRALVVGFEEAAPGHGGSGALYVRIRRPAGR